MAKKKEFQVTIAYKAVIQVDVKAENEEEAKKQALEYFNDYRYFGNKSTIADDNYSAQGIINFTDSWNEVQK